MVNRPSRAVVVGGGFSGLTMAYYLAKMNIPTEVFEKKSVGGIIQTLRFPEMLVETAANAFLWSEELQAICDDIGVELVPVLPSGKMRFIWRNGFKRWPLGFLSSTKLTTMLLPRFIMAKKGMRPKPLETVAAWTKRILGEDFLRWLVEPALQGIYAGDVNAMSASLILKPFFEDRSGSGKKGMRSCAPKEGMGQFFEKLADFLKRNNVAISTKEISSEDLRRFVNGNVAVVIATDLTGAAKVLSGIEPDASEKIQKLNVLSAVKVTVAFERPQHQILGFGVLFPRAVGTRALGALANTHIFPGRGNEYNETWIFGGALDPKIIDLTDDEILQQLLRDRSTIFGGDEKPTRVHIVKWPKAFVHYDLDLEKSLPIVLSHKNIFLVGNYLGSLGLSKLLLYVKAEALKVAAVVNG